MITSPFASTAIEDPAGAWPDWPPPLGSAPSSTCWLITTFWNAEAGGAAHATGPEKHMVRTNSRAVDADMQNRDESLRPVRIACICNTPLLRSLRTAGTSCASLATYCLTISCSTMCLTIWSGLAADPQNQTRCAAGEPKLQLGNLAGADPLLPANWVSSLL